MNEENSKPWVAIILGVFLIVVGHSVGEDLKFARWDTVGDLTVEMYVSYGTGLLFLCMGIWALFKDD